MTLLHLHLNEKPAKNATVSGPIGISVVPIPPKSEAGSQRARKIMSMRQLPAALTLAYVLLVHHASAVLGFGIFEEAEKLYPVVASFVDDATQPRNHGDDTGTGRNKASTSKSRTGNNKPV